MDKKLRNIVLSIVGLIFIGLLFVFVFKPLMEKISKIKQDIRLAEAEVKRSLAVQSRKEEIAQEYKKYQPYLIQAGATERQRIGTFLKELERTTQEANLSVTSLNPQDVQVQDGSLFYGADLKAEGDIEEILFFFSKIQESKLLIEIDKFSLTPKDEAANTLSLDAKIGMFLPQD